jgi:GNAT superfamily N-acetyltransferase
MTADDVSIDVRPVRAANELKQILELQRSNLAAHVSREEAAAQGFVTVVHDEQTLGGLHSLAPSIVAWAEGTLAGYALTMLAAARRSVPQLAPMFEMLDQLQWRGRPLPTVRYYVMGQVCVAKPFRGQGVFDRLYDGHRREYSQQFDLLVTEIATRNTRSLRAHERVGFRPLHRFQDHAEDWMIVAWDWSG